MSRSKGFKHSLKTRKKISNSHKGVNLSSEHRTALSKAHIGISAGMLGKKHTEESKRKMSLAHIGIKHTPEARHNMSESKRGLRRTAEAKHNMSEAQKRRKHPPHSEKTRRAISEALKGRKPSFKGEDYICHHKDLNHSNNDQDNLQVMTGREHSRLHARLSNNLIGKNRQ